MAGRRGDGRRARHPDRHELRQRLQRRRARHRRRDAGRAGAPGRLGLATPAAVRSARARRRSAWPPSPGSPWRVAVEPVAAAGRRSPSFAAGWFYTGGPSPTATPASASCSCSCSSGWSPRSARRTCRSSGSRAVASVAAVPVGLLATALLVVNNLRDIPTDTVGGQAHAGGAPRRPAHPRLYVVLDGRLVPGRCRIVAGAAAAPVARARASSQSSSRDGRCSVVLEGATGPALIPVLGATGRVQLVFGVLLAVGLVLRLPADREPVAQEPRENRRAARGGTAWPASATTCERRVRCRWRRAIRCAERGELGVVGPPATTQHRHRRARRAGPTAAPACRCRPAAGSTRGRRRCSRGGRRRRRALGGNVANSGWASHRRGRRRRRRARVRVGERLVGSTRAGALGGVVDAGGRADQHEPMRRGRDGRGRRAARSRRAHRVADVDAALPSGASRSERLPEVELARPMRAVPGRVDARPPRGRGASAGERSAPARCGLGEAVHQHDDVGATGGIWHGEVGDEPITTRRPRSAPRSSTSGCAAGVTDAVVAPGSRSTPLALALAADARIARARAPRRALGGVHRARARAWRRGRPAVVLTTSGTAAVELHPAVVEAHQAGVPLHRRAPPTARPSCSDVGAPQTIDQTHLFGRSVRWFADPGVPDDAHAGTWRSLAARVVAEAARPAPARARCTSTCRSASRSSATPGRCRAGTCRRDGRGTPVGRGTARARRCGRRRPGRRVARCRSGA